MKQVVAIVKPYLAEKVLDTLKRAPVEALNVREVKGYGRQKSYLDEYGESEYSMAFLPKVEVALWVDDARVDEIVRKIVAIARTGRMGDGKVFVLSVDSFENIVDVASGDAASASVPAGGAAAASAGADAGGGGGGGSGGPLPPSDAEVGAARAMLGGDDFLPRSL